MGNESGKGRIRTANTINLANDEEVKYWCGTLACSVMELKAAVIAVGFSPDRVKEYLRTSATGK